MQKILSKLNSNIFFLLPVLAVVFLLGKYFISSDLLNRLEAIPSSYLSSDSTAGGAAAGTLFTALSSNGFTLGSSALVNSVGSSLTSTSFTYTSDGNTSTAFTKPFGMSVSGNYLYVSHNGDDRVSIYDISTTDSPSYITSFSTNCTIGDLLVASSTLYVTNYTSNNFSVYDLTASSTSPTFVRSVTTGTYPIGIAKSAANYIYVANNTSNTISIYDASSSTNPTLSTSYSLSSNNPTGLAVNGSYLYVGHYDQALFRVLNISAPTAPSSVTTVVTGTNPMLMKVYGNVLLVSDYGANTIHQYNVSTASAPAASGNASFSAGGTSPTGIAFSSDGKEAYIANSGSNTFTAYNMGKEKYVAWNWKCGTVSGCYAFTYTGTGANRTISHSMGSAPTFMMIKRTDTTGNWMVYHSSLSNTKYMNLNGTSAATTDATVWNSTSPTASLISLGTNSAVNASGGTYQAYIFTDKQGFSKFGTYKGNGLADGPFIYTGFKPKYVMIKRTDAAGDWRIMDTARSSTNPVNKYSFANLTDVEVNSLTPLDSNANGFKLRDSSAGWNASGGTYFYAAFAEYPFEYATTNSGLSIASSTRFNGTNAYLSRTPASTGNRTTWTWSGWVKRGTLGTAQTIFGVYPSSGNGFGLTFTSGDKIDIQNYTSSVVDWQLQTTSVYRDPSAWYHIVLAVDTTQLSPSKRVLLYVNGVQQTSFSTISYPSLSFTSYVNNTNVHGIGALPTPTQYFSGYLSDIYFLDGQQLEPTGFAKSDTYGRWSPISYTGSYISASTAYIMAVLSNGFTLGIQSLVNTLSDNYVAWAWKKSSTSGMDIVSYSGTGVAHTIAHSLGTTPSMMIIKRTDAAGMDWIVWHKSLTSTTTGYLFMNFTTAQSTSAGMWNSTVPTSANFSVGTSNEVNISGGTYVAYLFAEKSGFSKFGSYTGNGSTDGPFVYTGFKPRYVMVKRTDSTSDWVIYDTARSSTNPVCAAVYPDLTSAETSVCDQVDMLANGFKAKVAGGTINTSSGTYVYAAFAEYPFEYASTNSGLSVASSTRFNGTNAYLSRTPSTAGNRTTWTWSGWVKRAGIGRSFEYIFDSSPGSSNETSLRFQTDSLDFYSFANGVGTTGGITTTAKFRDPSAWYHVVAVWDTTNSTASDRIKLYVNGVRQTGTYTTPSSGLQSNINNTLAMNLGMSGNSSSNFFAGYLSDVYFIDGQALDPTYFAQSDSNGRWSPKTYVGSNSTTTVSYTTAGTYTFTVPSTFQGLSVTVKGGGAGGTGCDGVGGPYAGGGSGGASSFNGTVIANGGGQFSDGTASGGDTNITGGGATGGVGSYAACNGINNSQGGNGGSATKYFTSATLTPGSSVTVVVGSGGSGGGTVFTSPNGGTGSVSISYSNIYGTNGFHLNFASASNPGADANASTNLVTQTITTTGAGTFTVPNYVGTMTVQLWGAGGGGGAGSSDSGGNGTAGGNTTFSPALGTLTAGGGGGGFAGYASFLSGPAGPTASGGNINTNGSAGGMSNWYGGNGGSAPNGGAGGAGTGANTLTTGGAGTAPGGGGGGGGGDNNTQAGGTGGASGAYVSKSYAQGAISAGTVISYSVGSGGAGGTPCCSGTSPTPGGAGARGQITITYYLSGNNFTNNNIASTDNVIDSPTNNFPVLNSVSGSDDSATSISNGALTTTFSGANTSSILDTTANIPAANKVYFETTLSSTNYVAGSLAKLVLINRSTGSLTILAEQNISPLSVAAGDTVAVAIDMSTGNYWTAKNAAPNTAGAATGSVTPDGNYALGYYYASALAVNATWISNFGQGGQSGLTYDSASGGYFKYTPPSGFKALSSANMISAGTTNSSLVVASNWFNAVTYTGTGASQSITSFSFQPDLVWIKDRTSAVSHLISDSVNGITCYMSSNSTNALSCATSGNSFHLPLMGTSTASLGTDTTGNGQFFTNNNIASTDFMIDTPTNNFPTAGLTNYYDNRATQSTGGLTLTSSCTNSTGAGSGCVDTYGFGIPKMKIYWETKVSAIAANISNGTDSGVLYVGVTDNTGVHPMATSNYGAAQFVYTTSGSSCPNAVIYTGNNCGPSFGTQAVTNDVIMTAFDPTTGNIWFGRNGTWLNSGNPATGANPSATISTSPTYMPFSWMRENDQSSAIVLNFGQGGQSGLTYDSTSGGYFKYTPPSGFKALSSVNMISTGVTSSYLIKSNSYFDVVTYQGNGSTKVISSLNFQPDIIWIKDRTSAVSHVIFGDGTTITNAINSFFQWFEY